MLGANKKEYYGILLAILATFFMVLMSATIHGLGDGVPVGQIIFWRSFVAILPIFIFLGLRGRFPQGLSTLRPGAHIVRSLFGVLSMMFSFLSLAYLSVTAATFFVYLIPVMVVPVAAIVLREHIQPANVVATGVAFLAVGLVLFAAPDTNSNEELLLLGGLAGLGYAVTMVFVKIYVKKMTETETPESIAFYFSATGAIVGLTTILWGWVAPSPEQWILLIGSGLLGGVGQVIAVYATSLTRLSVLAPIEYTGVIWAILIDIMIFSNTPTIPTLIAMVIIISVAWWSVQNTRNNKSEKP